MAYVNTKNLLRIDPKTVTKHIPFKFEVIRPNAGAPKEVTKFDVMTVAPKEASGTFKSLNVSSKLN